MILSGVALTCSGVIVSLVGELAARGVLRRNGGAGIRISSVMRTEATWRAGHRAARAWLHGAAVGFCGAGLSDVFAPPRIAQPFVLIGMASGFCLLIGGAVVAHRAAGRTDDPAAGEPTGDPYP